MLPVVFIVHFISPTFRFLRRFFYVCMSTRKSIKFLLKRVECSPYTLLTTSCYL